MKNADKFKDVFGLYATEVWSMPEGEFLRWLNLDNLPSIEPEQRYTKEELRVFQHGISISLLSKRSAQHWKYDEDRDTEIKFLERLYEKVGADMRGEQNEQND